ncbi:MAG: protein kinase [Myxococcota bacterium]|nr:protein kinase [Myxococcota bacterium]
MSDLLLGPLELTTPIGQGGMGMVWRGHWHPLNLPVAVKVIRSQDPRILGTFHNEIRAVAGLNHPNIVSIYHQGHIPEDVAARSAGTLHAGALYLVMELVEGGSIRSRCGRLRWSAIRTVLLSLLAALGHAHARGVIHRDIKPGNILIGPRSTIGRVRLTDFGIARDIRTIDADALGAMGTPRYMAPEQSARRWHQLGPWTDLYALARVTQALVCGVPGQFSTAEAHWTPLPEGLQAWLARMMAPEPADRFQCAADAAFALQSLRDPPSSSATQPTGRRPVQPDKTMPLEDEGNTWQDVAAEAVLVASPAVEMCARIPPPFPIDWRPGEPTVRPLPVLGLSLFGLRTPPLLGREHERDVLWRLLESASEGHRRLAVVEGPPGTGKSRLVSWLVERGASTGTTSALVVRHSERGLGALERALARQLSVIGLDRSATAAQVELHLRQHGNTTAYEQEALTELLCPSGAVRFDSPGERYAVILRTLRRLSLYKPLLLWVEDAQWGSDALGLVQHIMAARRGLPILIVLTWTAMPDRPLESEQIQALRPDARLVLDALPRAVSDVLTRDILQLSAPLAARLSAHIQGNPMFGIQIATDWVERGLLTAGPEGLSAAEPPPLPVDLASLWMRRVEAVLETRSLDDARALELAAVLGGPIDTADWAAGCAAEGVSPSADLTSKLLDLGLARQHPGEGRQFAHWLFGLALERHAQSQGRLEEHHRACADVIAQRSDPGSDLRAASHMLAAGDDEAALAPLLAAARRLAVTGAHRQGVTTLEIRQAAMDRIGLAPHHTDRLKGMLISSYFAQMTGSLTRGVATAHQVTECATGRLRIRALQQLSRLRRDQGRFDEAGALVAEAEASADEPLLLAHCHRDSAVLLLRRGDLDAAEAKYLSALTGYAQSGEDRDRALVHKGLSQLKMKQGRFDEAIQHIEVSRTIHARLGGRLGLAGCINAQGEIHRAQGELDAAERCYRAALNNLQDTALSAEVITEINLALVLIARGQHDESEEILVRGHAYFSESGQQWMCALMTAYRLPGLIAAGRRDDATACAAEALRLAKETRIRDADAARLVQSALDGCTAPPALCRLLSSLLSHHRGS